MVHFAKLLFVHKKECVFFEKKDSPDRVCSIQVFEPEHSSDCLRKVIHMRIGPFHISEILGGVAGVVVVGVLVRPTPVVLGVIAFIVGQVVVRGIRNQRGL
jgi:hypothetical protein